MIITPVLIIDILGIIIGIVSISMMLKLKQTLGGRIGGALNMVISGVLFNMLAFIWTVIFTRLKLLVAPQIDVHHLLMTIGMILFVIAARKFSSLIHD